MYVMFARKSTIIYNDLFNTNNTRWSRRYYNFDIWSENVSNSKNDILFLVANGCGGKIIRREV